MDTIHDVQGVGGVYPIEPREDHPEEAQVTGHLETTKKGKDANGNPIPLGWPAYDTISSATPASTTATKATLPSNQPASLWDNVTRTASGIAGWFSSLWSNSDQAVESETPAAAQESSTETSYYEALTQWAGRIWNYMNVFGLGQTPSEPVQPMDSRFLAPLHPRDRAELDKLLKTFSLLMAKMRENMTEAELEELMETLLLLAQQDKNEEFHLHKSNLMKKHDNLREDQLKKLQAVDEYIAELKRNKLWSRIVDVSTTAGFVTASYAAGGALFQVPTICYALGVAALKLGNAYYGDRVAENYLAGWVAWAGVGKLFGASEERTRQGASHLIEFGFGIGTILATFSLLGVSKTITSQATLLESIGSIFKGYRGMQTERRQGELQHQGFKIKERQEGIQASTKDLARVKKDASGLWKASARHGKNNHDTITSMLR